MLRDKLPSVSAVQMSLLRRLAAAFVLFSVSAIGFIALADEVREGETRRIDEAILLWVNERSTALLDQMMIGITTLGGVWVLATVTAALVGYLWYRRRTNAALMLAASMVGAALLNIMLKSVFARERPDLWTQLVTETSFSFPSGHAMGSSALALSLIIIFWQTKWRWLIVVVGSIYVLLVGVSRVYLGVHFPSDVLAGWLVSTGWVVAVAGFLARRIHRRFQTK